jgi:hypothetical protein
MKTEPSVATLIGDVVQSRSVPERAELHATLAALLRRANAELQPLVPLRITVGDEFQGCFSRLGEALHATLWLRLHLAPVADLRHGVGWGVVEVLADSPRVEDGPGWWAAREAIEWVKAEAGRATMRRVRTAYRRAEEIGGTEDQAGLGTGAGTGAGSGTGAGGPDPDPINAALFCRDQMVGSVSHRSVRLLRGTLAGRSQVELAEDEAISASAVSQRVRNDGLGVIVAANELLRRIR